MTDVTEIKPDLTLSFDDKIYLAVAKENTEKLAFVYTLACLKKSGIDYSMLATKEIHAFRKQEAADLYCATIEKIVEKNTENKKLESVFFENKQLIEQFYENIR